MSVANDKALRDLEFDRLKAIVRGYASSSLGEEAVDALIPLVDRAAIEEAAVEVKEAMRFLEKTGRFSLGGVRDLAPYLRRGHDGAHLDGEEWLVVLQTIDATRQIQDQFLKQDEFQVLRGLSERLTGGGEVVGRSIRQTIDERGSVRDDASPELLALIKKRRSAEARVETKLRALIERSPELISEPIITRRRGRLVVPVRSGAIGMADFVVHDRSSTGQTLYAEPTSLVAENNAVAEMSEAIRDEILRILRRLTALFLDAEAAFLRDRAALAHLDSLFARAGYAQAYRCAFPKLGKRLSVRDARHPLLPRDRAVPVSLSLADGNRMTVITGPNTGGKTVTLKTLGLLTLMTQATIPIPASPDSEVRIVSKIRTDIGDEQSIEQSLSTFSAHMKNIVAILADADAESLVLLDELGAGTDPQEGAALGLSVIENLLGSGALVAISTHLTPLKYFAIRHPEIKTASMEFDLGTLSPTFRVVEGVPGKSNAFVIAQRLGLAGEMIERAKSFLSGGEIRAEDIIEELHRERQILTEQRESAERERSEARRLREEYERKMAAFEAERETALSRRVKAFEQFLREGQHRVEQILASAHGEPEAKAGLHEIVDLRQQASAQRGDLQEASRPQPLDPESLELGQLVRVRSVDGDGRIVHLDARGKVAVNLEGGIRISTDLSDLEAPRHTKERAVRTISGSVRRPTPGRVPLQIDLRGMTVSEALREVEAYLDQLLRADIRSAAILHGKGTGALRDAVRSYLGSCTFVKAQGFAPPNQGGEGVTVFELGDGETRN